MPDIIFSRFLSDLQKKKKKEKDASPIPKSAPAFNHSGKTKKLQNFSLVLEFQVKTWLLTISLLKSVLCQSIWRLNEISTGQTGNSLVNSSERRITTELTMYTYGAVRFSKTNKFNKSEL